MSDLRAPGNPGGTRGHSNPAYVQTPLESTNSNNSAPAGERPAAAPLKRTGANNKKPR